MPLVIPQEPVITEDGVVTTPARSRLPISSPRSATTRSRGKHRLARRRRQPNTSPCRTRHHARCSTRSPTKAVRVFETAGALRGGREIFVTMRLPKAMTFDGSDGSKDRTDFYLAALNSHDGNSKYRLLLTSVRIVCANTQSAAIAGAKSTFGIRHTNGARVAIQEAAPRFAWHGATWMRSRPKPPPSTRTRWSSTRCVTSLPGSSRPATRPPASPRAGVASSRPAASSSCGCRRLYRPQKPQSRR